MDNKKVIRFIKSAGKIALWVLSPVVLLLLIASLVTFSPGVQNILKNKAVEIVKDNLHTNMSLESLRFIFPKTVRVQNLYLEGIDGDTLINAELVKLNINLIALLRGEIEIAQFDLENAQISIHRNKIDSLFNYNFPLKKNETKTEETEAMNVSVNRVHLKNVQFFYKDSVSNSFVFAKLGGLQVNMDRIDIQNNAYAINRVLLDNARVAMSVAPSTDQTTESDNPQEPGNMMIHLKNDAKLVNCDLKYENLTSGQKIVLNHANLLLKSVHFDQHTSKTSVELVELFDSEIQLELFETADSDSLKQTVVIDKSAGSQPWEASVDQLRLRKNAFSLDDYSYEPLKDGFDSHHLSLNDINVTLNSIKLSPDDYSMRINELSFYENKKFAVNEMAGSLRFSNNELLLQQFVIKTQGSSIGADLSLAYPSIEKLMALSDSLVARNSNLGADIALHELAYFVPMLKDSFPQLVNERFKFNTSFHGIKQGLVFTELNASLSRQFKLSASGSVAMFDSLKDMNYSTQIKNLHIFPKNNLQIFAAGALPENIRIPEALDVSGNIKGTINRINLNLNAQSTQGILKTALTLESISDKEQHVQGNFTLTSYNLGELLGREEEIGNVSAHGELEMKTFAAALPYLKGNITIDSIDYNAYRYQNLVFSGRLDKADVQFDVSIDDPNLQLRANGHMADLGDSVQQNSFEAEILGADLAKLKLSEENIQFSSSINSVFVGSDADNLNGFFTLKDFIVYQDGQLFRPDSVHFIAAQKNGYSDFSLQSSFLRANYTGTLNASEIAPTFQYFKKRFLSSDSIAEFKRSKDSFKLRAKFNTNAILSTLILPELDLMDDASLDVDYFGENGKVDIKMLVPALQYQTTKLDSFKLNIHTNDAELAFDAGFDALIVNNNAILNTALVGKMHAGEVISIFSIKNKELETRYSLKNQISFSDTTTKFHLYQDDLTLNGNPWKVEEQNALYFGEQGLRFENFTLQRNTESMSAQSFTTSDGTIHKVVFSNFKLQTFLSFTETPSKMPSARVNGNIGIRQGKALTGLTADLKLDTLRYSDQDLFNTMHIVAERNSDLGFNLNMQLINNKDTSLVDGTFETIEDKNKLNFRALLSNLNLAHYQGFVSRSIPELKGSLNGQLALTGSTDQPFLDGTLRMTDVTINPSFLNSPLYFKDESVSISNNQIKLNDFSFHDKFDNKAQINGSITYSRVDPLGFDLRFNANNFLLLDTKAKDNDLYYGRLKSDVEATLKGTVDKPVVALECRLKDGSEMFFMVPESETSLSGTEGIVQFVDKDSTHNVLKNMVDTSSIGFSQPLQIDLKANISFEKNIPLSIIIDPVANEQLNILGKGDLSFRMNEREPMSLAGIYTIKEGSYNLTLYQVFKRKFSIVEGSSLIWSGDIMEPISDIRARYTVETSPFGLVSDELVSTNNNLKQYRSIQAFYVQMNLAGQLLSPEIDFDILTPPGKADALVARKLAELNSNESELNKQVLSLLVFKSFMGKNSSSNAFAYTINNTARASVSNLLSNSFNRFAQNYIKGFDLSFDVDSRAGQNNNSAQTDLKLGASKSMFNDRLSVEVGSSINIEGQNGSSSDSHLAGDFLIDYKLTENGEFSVQAFRSSEYEDVLVGDVTKTGVSLKFDKKFFRFGDLFKRKKKKTKEVK